MFTVQGDHHLCLGVMVNVMLVLHISNTHYHLITYLGTSSLFDFIFSYADQSKGHSCVDYLYYVTESELKPKFEIFQRREDLIL